MYNTSPKLHTKTSPELLTLQVTQHLAGRNPTRLTREQRLFWSCIPWGRSCGNAVTKLLAAKLLSAMGEENPSYSTELFPSP